MKRDATSPAQYLAQVGDEQRRVLDRIRQVIRKVAPHVPEGIRYGMLDYPGLANLGAQKHHVALYVMPEVLARHLESFEEVDCGKSCLRFRRHDQIDERAIETLLEEVLAARGGA